MVVTALLVLFPLDRKLEQDALDLARGDHAHRAPGLLRPQPRAARRGVAGATRDVREPAAPDRRGGVRVRRLRRRAGGDRHRPRRALPRGAARAQREPPRHALRARRGPQAGARRRAVHRRRRPRRARAAALARGASAASRAWSGARSWPPRSSPSAVALRGGHRARDAARAAPDARCAPPRCEMAERGPDGTPPVDDGHRDEVGDLARAFATMQRRLAAQEQSRRTFVSTASHELRTPLTSLGLMLHGASEELDRRAAGPARGARPAAPRARPDGAAGQARRGAARPQPPRRRRRAARGARRAGRARALGAGGVRASATRAPSSSADGPYWAQADPGAIARIARILLNNAHRHGGPDGRVVLRVDRAARRIEVVRRRARRPARRGGADLRALPARRRRPARTAASGSGWRSAASSREQMGGELTLEPSDRGATFRATFPAAGEDVQTEADRRGPSQHGPNTMLTTARSPPGTIGSRCSPSPPSWAIRSSSP